MTKHTDTLSNMTKCRHILCEKTFAEFFAGIGLMRMGLEKEGWTIAFANDIAFNKWMPSHLPQTQTS